MTESQQGVGVLAFGSLLADPGAELLAALTGKKGDVETPFPVEFARTSDKRAGAPTLVPMDVGRRVRGTILVLNVSEEEATHRLYRREINRVGSAQRYQPPAAGDARAVRINRLPNFGGVGVVLYAHLARNIEDLSAARLAQLAIESARTLNDGRDGITYLMDAKQFGIRTELSEDYEEEIKRQVGVKNLPEALRISGESRISMMMVRSIRPP